MGVLGKQPQRVLVGLCLIAAFIVGWDVYQTGLERTVNGFSQALNVRVESNVPQMGFATPSSEDLIHFRFESAGRPGEIASPEVMLRWDPVPGTTVYRVGMAPLRGSSGVGHNVTIRYFHETEATEMKLNLDELRWTWWERQHEESLIAAWTLLGAIVPGDRPLFKIDAHAEDGRLLASSAIIGRGHMAVVQGWRVATDGSTGLAWSEEAQAIREKRFGDALVGLQRRLAQDPDDAEALHILFRAYYFGIDRDQRYHNPELAVIYGTRLLNILPPGAVREGYVQRVAEMADQAKISWVDRGTRQEGEQ